MTAKSGGDGPRRISILGSTGSIGCSTLSLLDFAKSNGGGDYEIAAMTAHRNLDKLVEQARKYRPEFVVIGDETRYAELKDALGGLDIELAAGESGVIEAGERDSDWVMAAIVGAAGLKPTLAAARRGADIALANKECLVCAGPLFTEAVTAGGGALLPVDSEHNAIFQVFDFERPERVSRLILTASGGPFREWSWAQMEAATPEQAVAHPNWSMGAKISVDSATMMNKGLELIEAAYLFPVRPDQVDIIVHPQSVIHSLVEYVDGSTLAQLGAPDMRTPIASALAWPDRMASPSEKLDLGKAATLTFEDPDPVRFPALALARKALEAGGAATAVLNAANEIAVQAFLERRIRFTQIPELCGRLLEETDNGAALIDGGALRSLDDAFHVDAETRRLALSAATALAA
ncbi:MAG: 1-deoxy-D-xylulose-5-phosphate reductoisomerase [Parvularculaceae bacterium]